MSLVNIVCILDGSVYRGYIYCLHCVLALVYMGGTSFGLVFPHSKYII